jgi:hypothetical protein
LLKQKSGKFHLEPELLSSVWTLETNTSLASKVL